MLRPQEKMLVLAVLLFLCFTPASGVDAKRKIVLDDGTPLSALDKQHVLQDNFVLVKTVQALPKAVQQDLVGKDVRSGMADAGQPFERTDMVGFKPLPFQRLIFAGTSAGYCFVYSEHGGIAYWTSVSLYRLSEGQADLVWRGNPQSRLNILDLAQLQSAIANGKFTNAQLPQTKASF